MIYKQKEEFISDSMTFISVSYFKIVLKYYGQIQTLGKTVCFILKYTFKLFSSI